MNYDGESGRATYEFIRGVPGKSLAFATAKKIGILDSVYTNAKLYLSPTGKKRLQTMENVDKMKDELTKLRSELRKEIDKTQKKQNELDKLTRDFEIKKEERLTKEVKQALVKIKDELSKGQIKNLFEQNEKRQKISIDFPEIVKYSSINPGQEKDHDNLQSFLKAFPPGSVVFVSSLNQDGIVQGDANSKGDIPILSGSMRLFVDWQLLKPPKKTQNPLKKKNNSTSTDIIFDTKKDEIDLRGLTTNEAIEKLELTLDNAQANQIERVKIIHGNGSDTLKKAIRSHLSRSVYVSRWQVSGSNEGGDGTTLAYLMGD
jgi:DNA mismatch repair protein MutS2